MPEEADGCWLRLHLDGAGLLGPGGPAGRTGSSDPSRLCQRKITETVAPSVGFRRLFVVCQKLLSQGGLVCKR